MIEFQSWPLTHFRVRGFFALFVLVFALIVSYIFLKSLLFVILVFFIITTPSMPFLFPSKYCFNEECLIRTQLGFSKEFKYGDFSSHKLLDDGILLIRAKKKKVEFLYCFDSGLMKQSSEFLVSKGITFEH